MRITAETYRGYLKRLHKLNVRKLGEGGFGAVFQHPEFSNVVVKVVREDALYLKFAKFAMDNPKNPWLPKIADIRMVPFDDSKKGYLVFTEKLKSPSEKDIMKFKMLVPGDGKHRAPSMERTDPENYHKLLLRPGWQRLEKSRNLFLAQLATFMLKNYRHLDLGIRGDNMMMRGSQLVFTDPLA